MRKLVALGLCLLLALAPAVPAGAEAPEESWTLYELKSGTLDDFDGNATQEAFNFAVDVDEYGDGSFALSVGGLSVAREDCMALTGTVYAMKIGYGDDYYGTMFLVSELGPSDDPYTYCFLYTDEALLEIGDIPALAAGFEVSGEGMITASVRTDTLGTWNRPADYVLAQGLEWSEDYEESTSYYHLCEVPREIYPFGRIATLKTALPLLEDRLDESYAAGLPADEQVILAATDCKRWLYVTSLDGRTAGWVRMNWDEEDWEAKIQVGEELLAESDVFSGLMYAD